MSSDPDAGNNEELLSQIDDLKARMDRLMSGGTSTSNSALLTDKPEAEATDEASVAPPPGPSRTRVRDLIEGGDTEVIESYPGPKEVVPFPEDEAQEGQPVAEPEPVDRAGPVGGSVVPMEEDRTEARPRVSSFDDLGSAIEQELARDDSVPPPDAKRGPDLASRFGPPDEVEPASGAQESPVAEPETLEEEDEDEPEADVEAEVEAIESDAPVPTRGNLGKVAAIWVITAVASGAIAALHFAGII